MQQNNCIVCCRSRSLCVVYPGTRLKRDGTVPVLSSDPQIHVPEQESIQSAQHGNVQERCHMASDVALEAVVLARTSANGVVRVCGAAHMLPALRGPTAVACATGPHHSYLRPLAHDCMNQSALLKHAGVASASQPVGADQNQRSAEARDSQRKTFNLVRSSHLLRKVSFKQVSFTHHTAASTV